MTVVWKYITIDPFVHVFYSVKLHINILKLLFTGLILHTTLIAINEECYIVQKEFSNTDALFNEI